MAGAQVQAGVVTQASLNGGMLTTNGSGTGSSAATWTYVWFGAAVLFILAVYFGFGGLRGSVAS
jgi:hypothetical protein